MSQLLRASAECARHGRPAIAPATDLRSKEWDEYVARHPHGTSYHRPRWLEVIGKAFGHQSSYLTAKAGSRVAGVLPIVLFRSRTFGRFAVSVPFLNYGGVLADDADTERALLERAIHETTAAGGAHLELRHTGQHFTELASKRHKVSMELTLARTIDDEWNRLDRKVRNQVRKAERNGLIVTIGGRELLPQFYQVFAHNMRDLGTPVYPAGFFRAVLETFPDETRVFTVCMGARPLACSLVHWYRGRIEVPWASAIRESNPVCANVFLYWHMLRFAVERRFDTFDFGRSTPDGGTFHFKRQWGAVAKPLVWEYWTAAGARIPNLSPDNTRFALAVRMWQRLPLKVATAIGPHIVRNIP